MLPSDAISCSLWPGPSPRWLRTACGERVAAAACQLATTVSTPSPTEDDLQIRSVETAVTMFLDHVSHCRTSARLCSPRAFRRVVRYAQRVSGVRDFLRARVRLRTQHRIRKARQNCARCGQNRIDSVARSMHSSSAPPSVRGFDLRHHGRVRPTVPCVVRASRDRS
jgi:hypothetical protein